MSNFSFLKSEDGVLEILGHNPERFNPTAELINNILRGESELSISERELIFAYVSACNSCSFCMGAHQEIAQEFGLALGVLDELVNSGEHKSIDAKLKPCLALAKKVAKESSRVVKEDVSAIINAGWQEETAHDVVSIAALATFYNLLVNAHGVSGTPDYFKMCAKMFGAKGGYIPPA
ncbi:MAG: peroxidase [Gammaproteobacteria bacterium]|nr:MAG: peroxidase [Gammaproteobacteria bacterium]